MDRGVAVITGGSRGIGAAVLWFLAEESSYCTGSILDVAGGR